MRLFLLSLLALLMLLTPGSSQTTPPGPAGGSPAAWKKIDQLLAKDQTTSAAKLLEPLYQQARRQQNTPEYLRALLYKLRILEQKEEEADYQAIALLEADLRTARFPARPILHSLLAQLYAAYYQEHRYQLLDRTTQAVPNPADASAADLRTWDAARLGSAVVRHYRASLAEQPQRLQRLPLRELGYAVRGGDAEGRALRPTLYDLLAHRAVDGLQNDEYYVTRPAAQFELTDPALLGPAADFARLLLTAPPADSLNGQFQALQVLQQLTRFRLQDQANPAALADVELKRLRFVAEHAELADKDALYRTALARAAETFRSLPISTEFMAAQAESLAESQPAQARKLAQAAEKAFPKSRGAGRARALRQRIEAMELRFTVEDVVLPGQPWLLKLTVRNAPQLYARAYRISQAQVLRQLERPDLYAGKTFWQQYGRVLTQAPAATWTLPVPGSQDYRSHTVQHAGPALPLGHYLLVLSTAPEVPTKEQAGPTAAYAQLSVSELSQVRRAAAGKQGGTQVLVLHRQSGKALGGVQVRPMLHQFNAQRNQWGTQLGESAQTSAEGLALLPADEAGNIQVRRQTRGVLLRRGPDTLLVQEYYGYYNSRNADDEAEEPSVKTFLFTDRAIYRPGQTVYFKGIMAERAPGGKTRVLAGREETVALLDVNGQTVQEATFRTNEFGSFHGSFVLPVGLLNGEMQLQAQEDDESSSVGFAVEDYKRPTFQVTLAPVAGTPVLGQAVTVRGQATAYAGQPIDRATVQYRVVRRTLWPMFGRPVGGGDFGFPGRGGDQVEILNGTVQTDSAGGFAVTFVAKGEAPGAGKRGPWEPGYVFEITADVTDAAGETRTGEQRVSLGTEALTLRLDVPELLNRAQVPALRLLSTNAAGEAQPARGQLRLYRLAPPARALRPRAWERPEREALSREEFKRRFPLDAYAHEDQDSTWARTLVLTLDFDTEKTPLLPELAASLARGAPGRYLLEATAATPAGSPPARLEQRFTLFDPAASRQPVPTPDWFVSLQDSVAPGQPARFLVGSSEDGARVLFQAEAKGQPLRQEWLTLRAGEQRVVEVAASAAALGETQLYVHTAQVRDNRLYTHSATVQVAPPPAPLALSIATFRDKLQPGQRETWRVTIRQANGQPAPAELLATLYDKSLDAFRMHDFAAPAFSEPYSQPTLAWQGRFGTEDSRGLSSPKRVKEERQMVEYPVLNQWGYCEPIADGFGAGGGRRVMLRGLAVESAAAMAAPAAPMAMDAAESQQLSETVVTGLGIEKKKANPTAQPDLTGVQARRDFRETAFWLPALRTNAQGETVLEFQMPEAVTRWQLLALAHDPQLRTGLLRRELVTQKSLQVTPNAPRFFREGDRLTFSAKLSNLTAQALSGTAQLFLLDARTQQPLDSRLLQSPAQLSFALTGNQSQALTWELTIPETAQGQVPLEAITYRVVAKGQVKIENEEVKTDGRKRRAKAKNQKPETNNQPQTTVEDGEENTLPVLPNRLLVTESLPLPVVGPATREFELKKLTSTTSPTRRHYSLTLEMTANPAWYAVQALPYLMEYPYECSEQVFSRLYANLVAARILQSTPQLRTTLAEWQRAAQAGDPAALTSKLEQNQDLRNLLLQETPWVRDARSETERMRRLAELFDEPRLQAETARTLTKLRQMQLPDGAFPWFEDMPADRYITQLIVAGLGKLQRLGAFDAAQNEAARQVLTGAVRYLDGQLQADYAALRRQKGVNLKQDHLADLQIQALYARSFWPRLPVLKEAQPALAYYQQQAATYWLGRTRYLQAQAALALHRQKTQPAAVNNILTALTENALHSPELGMYWKDVRPGYYWREAPTETQATLIEAFNEIRQDQKSVDEMKLWLLKQKQVQNWESTRATADACYALLLRGSNWLQATQPLRITVGGQPVTPTGQQAGTGYFRTSWPAAEVQPAQGRVTVQKPDAGVAWGALYWQYFEQLDKITSAATSLQLERQLYREQRTTGGPVLERLTSTQPLRVGDVLVVRLVLRSDRDLEYVHLKDQRAAGLELISQTSGYRYQSGLGYYESPRDAATNFFISYFPKGTHTFEYRLRAAQAGDFSGGLSQLQCLYAPEFTTHSAGLRLQVAPLSGK
ncbi:alpha-2-macroglobulin family protein [Hymenobacter weizhouensis]|uniref:alpha-2-macroglobulin family protein n=1 Tax=Hymenobacter sp. YIM 151500-1 TaxID=2987689 RepID=UPI002225CC7F|nr:MG2 domain-containing protein [Hymenobacter sp. YIM 151500-1]UYZ63085.1 MG2 domain-containing protein [Hymenobacter sp. YIM 151500-1]